MTWLSYPTLIFMNAVTLALMSLSLFILAWLEKTNGINKAYFIIALSFLFNSIKQFFSLSAIFFNLNVLRISADGFYILYELLFLTGIMIYCRYRNKIHLFTAISIITFIWVIYAYTNELKFPQSGIPQRAAGALFEGLAGFYFYLRYKKTGNSMILMFIIVVWINALNTLSYPFTFNTWYRPFGFAVFTVSSILMGIGFIIIALSEEKIVIKESEQKITLLLEEKKLLLREVHHRIKNNMNTIRGLLTLQLSAVEDPRVIASLSDAESRVQSMILLYEKLYSGENYRELSIKDYLESLIVEVVGSFHNSSIVKIETEIDDVILNVNMLTPIGIITNELITNIMKYAFTGKESGIITVSAKLEQKHEIIIIQDNGMGISESISFDKSSGFGLGLVGLLAEQIGGNIRIERGKGTRFIIEFDI